MNGEYLTVFLFVFVRSPSGTDKRTVRRQTPSDSPHRLLSVLAERAYRLNDILHVDVSVAVHVRLGFVDLHVPSGYRPDHPDHVLHIDRAVRIRVSDYIESHVHIDISVYADDSAGRGILPHAAALGKLTRAPIRLPYGNARRSFMEMNTRIQVEHPVTEAVTGIDLVQAQLRIAAGEPLGFTQSDVQIRGHAIECRILAENPAENFRPCPGVIQGLYMPGGPGVRVDSAIYQGCQIPPFYDSMLAKLIVHAPTRAQAIAKMNWALAEFLVDGVDTNIDMQLELIRSDAFRSGTYDTGYLAELEKKGGAGNA